MKKMAPLIIAFLLGIAGWMVYQHQQTGRWSVLPVQLSPDEARLRQLKSELADLEGQIATEERVAARAGTLGGLGLQEKQTRAAQMRFDIQALELKLSSQKR